MSKATDKRMLVLSNTVFSNLLSYILYFISHLISIFDTTPMHYNYLFTAIRVFSDHLRTRFAPFLGDSGAASPLNIWDVIGPYLRTFFDYKTKKLNHLTIFGKNTEMLACINVASVCSMISSGIRYSSLHC